MENIEMNISEELRNAIILLARDYKKGSASDLAENLLAQVVKGRLKAKREAAAEKTGEMYDRMTKQFANNAELLEMLPSRQDFINKELTKLDDAIYYLGR